MVVWGHSSAAKRNEGVQTMDTADGSSNPNPPTLNWGKEALGIAGYVWKHFCRIYRDPDLGFQGAS